MKAWARLQSRTPVKHLLRKHCHSQNAFVPEQHCLPFMNEAKLYSPCRQPQAWRFPSLYVYRMAGQQTRSYPHGFSPLNLRTGKHIPGSVPYGSHRLLQLILPQVKQRTRLCPEQRCIPQTAPSAPPLSNSYFHHTPISIIPTFAYYLHSCATFAAILHCCFRFRGISSAYLHPDNVCVI